MASTDIITQKISIKGLGKHSLMPELTSDDSSRLNYQMAFSKFLAIKLSQNLFLKMEENQKIDMK